MPKYRLDPTAGGFPIVEDGEYTFKVVDVDIVPSKEEGKAPNLRVIARILDEGEYQGVELPTFFGLGDDARWKLSQEMANLGLIEEPVEWDEEEIIEAWRNLGKFRGKVKVRELPRTGTKFSSIVSFMPYKPSKPKKITELEEEEEVPKPKKPKGALPF